MRPDFRDVRFTVTSAEMVGRLQRLFTWLDSEEKRVLAELAKPATDPPQKTPAGIIVRTDSTAKRSALEHELAVIRDDRELAHVWLQECATSQTWQIGIELSRWLHRPTLALSPVQGAQ